MLSQFQIMCQLMRGQRVRYGFALGCLMIATLLNYCIPLIGTVTIDYALAARKVDSATPGLITWSLKLFGGADHLRAALWLAPVAMLALSLGSALFSFL